MKENAPSVGHDERQTACDGGCERDKDDRHHREEEPQGLLYFTRYESVPIMVDALFDAPTSREFTQAELAEKADLSPKSVSNRLDILQELGVVKQVDDTNRFQINLDGEITWELRELDSLIKIAQGSDEPPTRTNGEPDESEESHKSEASGEVLDSASGDAYDAMSKVRSQAIESHAD